MQEWFQTWNRPEYLEWAKEIPEGYLLLIIRQEMDNHLVVKAKLIMGEKGLPGFEVMKEQHAANYHAALEVVEDWKKEKAMRSPA